jgi:antitoxin (DNA-binding transcriptional repressor) of toxin-antitoxin stability system
MSTKQIDLNKTTITLDELLNQLTPDTEILIVRGNAPVARLAPASPPPVPVSRKLGLHQGAGHISDDFTDELTDDFWLGSDKL